MKVTETRLDTLIDNLNTLICEDDLLTRQSVKPRAGRGGHRRHESTRQHEKAYGTGSIETEGRETGTCT